MPVQETAPVTYTPPPAETVVQGQGYPGIWSTPGEHAPMPSFTSDEAPVKEEAPTEEA